MDSREHELFTRLWTTAQGAVAAYVHAALRDRSRAEDVVQEVAIAATRKFSEFDQDRSFTAWVLGIARFQVLGALRRGARDRHLLDGELAETLAEDAEDLAEDFDRERHFLHHCLEEVSGRARTALRCRYQDELGMADIAKRLKMKSGAVRTLLHRVRGQLEQCIGRKLAQEVENG